MGPVTTDRAFNIIKERNVRKERERSAKEMRASRRASARSRRVEDLTMIYNARNITTRADLEHLNTNELQAILHCADSGNAQKHKELKKQADLVAYVLKHPAHANLPPGDPAAAARVSRRPRAWAEDVDRSDEEQSCNNPGTCCAEESHNVDHFIAAHKAGRYHQILIRWEGYGSGAHLAGLPHAKRACR
ncbi:MAG: hypothetical protein SGPRY_000909 [Prymnesium sp.]